MSREMIVALTCVVVAICMTLFTIVSYFNYNLKKNILLQKIFLKIEGLRYPLGLSCFCPSSVLQGAVVMGAKEGSSAYSPRYFLNPSICAFASS